MAPGFPVGPALASYALRKGGTKDVERSENQADRRPKGEDQGSDRQGSARDPGRVLRRRSGCFLELEPRGHEGPAPRRDEGPAPRRRQGPAQGGREGSPQGRCEGSAQGRRQGPAQGGRQGPAQGRCEGSAQGRRQAPLKAGAKAPLKANFKAPLRANFKAPLKATSNPGFPSRLKRPAPARRFLWRSGRRL